MKTLMVTDPVHEANHTTCLPDTLSTWYPGMNKLNWESCEQFNSVICCVASSVAFENYMLVVQIFCAFYNNKILLNYARFLLALFSVLCFQPACLFGGLGQIFKSKWIFIFLLACFLICPGSSSDWSSPAQLAS